MLADLGLSDGEGLIFGLPAKDSVAVGWGYTLNALVFLSCVGGLLACCRAVALFCFCLSCIWDKFARMSFAAMCWWWENEHEVKLLKEKIAVLAEMPHVSLEQQRRLAWYREQLDRLLSECPTTSVYSGSGLAHSDEPSSSSGSAAAPAALAASKRRARQLTSVANEEQEID